MSFGFERIFSIGFDIICSTSFEIIFSTGFEIIFTISLIVRYSQLKSVFRKSPNIHRISGFIDEFYFASAVTGYADVAHNNQRTQVGLRLTNTSFKYIFSY